MNIEQIKELIAILENSKLKKLSFKNDQGCELVLEKPDPLTPLVSSKAAVSNIELPIEAQRLIPAPQQELPKGDYVKAPMVGTFYTTQAPGEPPFIQVGDTISENSTVCIIEAMKVMNEIKAGVRGKVVEICAPNAQPVEFGTKLFRVEP